MLTGQSIRARLPLKGGSSWLGESSVAVKDLSTLLFLQQIH